MTRAARLASVLTLALLAAPAPAMAQPAGGAEPIMRATIDPPRVVVGQPTLLRIDVLAPNYMTSPPALPAFQIPNAVTRRLQSINQSERHDGLTYAGVRFEFAIYPQEAGSYAVHDQSVTVTYAAAPPQSRTSTLALPMIAFQAYIPDAAAGLAPFVAADTLTIEQAVRRSSDQLKPGDAVTRTVTITARGTPAMLLPRVAFTPAEGLALYPAQPSLQDRTDSRTSEITSTRIDSATYMMERPGDYLLPAVEIAWWNVRSQQVEGARIDPVALHVIGDPSSQNAAPAGSERGAGWSWDAVVGFIADHWVVAAVAAIVLAALIWLSPRAARAIAARYRQHRKSYLESESWSFGRLRAAARRRDPDKMYFALLDWLARFDPLAPNHSIDALKTAARDPALDAQIDSIEKRLFAPQASPSDWSARKLLRRIVAARRSLRRRASRTDMARPLPRDINPLDVSRVERYSFRKVAR